MPANKIHHPAPTRARADFAVHLYGKHTAEAVTLARSVLLVMPSVRLRLTHPQPVHAAHTAWREALQLARHHFREPGLVPRLDPGVQIGAHLGFSAPLHNTTVEALTAATSPNGGPQLRVRLDGLLIIALDHDAVLSQASVWATAYRHAVRLWPSDLPDVPADFNQPLCDIGTAA